MPYRLNRQEYEIDELLNRVGDLEERGTNIYPGMTYAQGVRDGVLWLADSDAEDDWVENGGYPLPDTQAEEDPSVAADADDLPFE